MGTGSRDGSLPADKGTSANPSSTLSPICDGDPSCILCARGDANADSYVFDGNFPGDRFCGLVRTEEAGNERNVDPGEGDPFPLLTGVVLVLVDCSNMAAAALTFDGVF